MATVSNTGLITAKAKGTTDITAKVGSVTSAIVTITVYEALVTVTNLASSNVSASGATLSWT